MMVLAWCVVLVGRIEFRVGSIRILSLEINPTVVSIYTL